MLVYPDGSIEGTIGGGILEKQIIDASLPLFEKASNQLLHFDLKEGSEESLDAVCGGSVDVFVEVINPAARLIIVGGGHVGQVLARMAVELPLQVEVFDSREEYLKPALYPTGIKTTQGSFEECMRMVKPTESDYIAIMTYGHAHDEGVLYNALHTPAKYIGLVASARKMKTFRENLMQKGISPERLDQVFAPIGLPIGGHTPAEIAVSILAQIVQEMNR
jgi:xanthine dehydrogenase accessory factor